MDKEGSGGKGKNDSEEGDALHRCLCREVATGSALLSKVRGDLVAVEKLCRGEAKATNEVRVCRCNSFCVRNVDGCEGGSVLAAIHDEAGHVDPLFLDDSRHFTGRINAERPSSCRIMAG